MTPEERDVMRAHADYWLPHVGAATVIAMGPVADPAGVWGVAIVNAPSLALARGRAGQGPGDPFGRGFAYRELSRCRRSQVASDRAAGAGLFRHPLNRRAPLAARQSMATEIRVPTLGESISEATVGKWFKQRGDAVKADEPLVELETEKVTLEVNAPAAGVLSEIAAEDRRDRRDRRAARRVWPRAARAAAPGAAAAKAGAAPRRAAKPRADRDAARAGGGEDRRRERHRRRRASPAAASAARC